MSVELALTFEATPNVTIVIVESCRLTSSTRLLAAILQ